MLSPSPFHYSKIACGKCGDYDFPNVSLAKIHQDHCQGSCFNSFGPWMCQGCGKTEFTTNAGFQSHKRCCYRRCAISNGSHISHSVATSHHHRQQVCTLCPSSPPHLEQSRLLLSDFNQLVTQWVDFIQATPEDVAVENTHNRRRRRPLQLGDVGVRCVACARVNHYSIGSVQYPKCLETLPHNVFLMVQRHLLGTCQHIPLTIKEQLEETKQHTTSQSMCKHRIGLPTYLKMIVEQYQLKNRMLGKEADGIIIVVVGSGGSNGSIQAAAQGESSSSTIATAPADAYGEEECTAVATNNDDESNNNNNTEEHIPDTSFAQEHLYRESQQLPVDVGYSENVDDESEDERVIRIVIV